MKKLLALLLVISLLPLCGCVEIAGANASGTSGSELQTVPVASETIVDWSGLHTYGGELENTKIGIQLLENSYIIVLPSTATVREVPLYLDIPNGFVLTVEGAKGQTVLENGRALDLTALCEDGDYTVTFVAQSGNTRERCTVTFYHSANVGTIYLVSDDPVNQGRAWVESSLDKSNKATGSMVMLNAQGDVVYNDALTQIKGRGNSTWLAEKKPYQIKLDKKTDLLETGSKDNKSKTWVLLANCFDPSSLRTTVANDLGVVAGLDNCLDSAFVDLYYDGEYRGTYLLSEKVEVASGRVDVTDMEDLNEEANPDVSLEDLPVATGVTANGATYTYCEGMASPADVTGGYLLELDYKERAEQEICYFYTTRGFYVVVKSPECASKEEMDYIASLYQDFEDALFYGGINPYTGKHYTEYADLDSLVAVYLINEVSKNMDSFRSSTYICKEAGDGVMTWGPLWDYDLSMGISNVPPYDFTESPEGMYAYPTEIGQALYKTEQFRDRVNEIYDQQIYPYVQQVLLESAAVEGSIAWYEAQLIATKSCNGLLWGEDKASANAQLLAEFVEQRTDYLSKTFDTWPTGKFCDISDNSWYTEGVYGAVEYGIMSGVSDSEFLPYTIATRGHVVQTIYNIAVANDAGWEYEDVFSDVTETDWYAAATVWASETGVVNGYPDGTFQPEKQVSRQDILVMLYRYQGCPVVDDVDLSAFSDENQIDGYAVDAMAWGVSQGLVQGFLGSANGNELRPQATATRGELAVILVRYYQQFCLNADPAE